MALPVWLGSDKVTLGPAQPVVITNAEVLAAYLAAGIVVDLGDIELFPEYTGTPRYVDPAGDDSDGLSWATAYNTITQAVADCSPTDVVNCKYANYNENLTLAGLVINKNFILIRCADAAQATITNTDTTNDGAAVTFDGAIGSELRNFTVNKNENISTGSAAVRFDNAATNCKLDEVTTVTQAVASAYGVHYTGGSFGCGVLGRDPVRSYVAGQGVGTIVYFENCTRCYLSQTGSGVATLGIRFGSNSLLCSFGPNCLVQDCVDGVQLDSGATLNMVRGEILRVSSNSVINASGNSTNYVVGALEHHEDIYPESDGQGAAGNPITVSNVTTDGAGGTRSDQNYWGDVTVVIPPNILTIAWTSDGIYVHSVTANDVQQFEILFIFARYAAAQNGGNDWDQNATVLTVDDGSVFQDGDYVWITGDDVPDGEVMLVDGAPVGNVVTLEREVTADTQAGLRYDYVGSPGNNEMYLVKRPGIAQYTGYSGDYSAFNSRSHSRYSWHDAKQLAPNDGMLMRLLNATDNGASSLEVRAVIED